MGTPRPCGCKGCRTCLICESQYGAKKSEFEDSLDKDRAFVYCPRCNAAWSGWNVDDVLAEHPSHEGKKISYSGVYIQLDFLSEDEEDYLMKGIDEMPWDASQSGRRKQNFGPKTNFKKRKLNLHTFHGFPKFSKFIQERFDRVPILKDYKTIEQCSLDYTEEKGASIDPHIDDCWVWGERIVTVNCLSDSVLTMTRFRGDVSKYNLWCADDYCPVVLKDGSVNTDMKFETSVYKASAPEDSSQDDVIVRIPMPRRSLLVLYGEARYHWEHAVLRGDISGRRVCVAYREFTPHFLPGGEQHARGEPVLANAELFWDHNSAGNNHKTN